MKNTKYFIGLDVHKERNTYVVRKQDRKHTNRRRNRNSIHRTLPTTQKICHEKGKK